MGKEAEAAKAIIDGDENDAPPGESGSVIDRRRTRSCDQGAAMYPEHDRQLRLGVGRGRPDVEVEAILAQGLRRGRALEHETVLYAVVPVGDRRTYAVPMRRGLRRAPSEIADGRRGVGNILEREDAVRSGSLQNASLYPHDRVVLRHGAAPQHQPRHEKRGPCRRRNGKNCNRAHVELHE